MNHVFVLGKSKQPLMPCHPARARQLLANGRARVYRRAPFTIIVQDGETGDGPPVEIKLDPGSRTTGLALVAEGLSGRRLAPVTALAVETVRFDMHLMQNPDIAGVEYLRGTLFGCELREYLLARHRHTCAYCAGGSDDQVLECDHVIPRTRGGTDRVGNLVIACRTCNQTKNNLLPAEWLAQLRRSGKTLDCRRADNLARITAGHHPGLADAAAVNATRLAIAEALTQQGLPVTHGTGGRTRFNRTAAGYPKAHWIDAACVGESGWGVRLDPETKPLTIIAVGRGRRQMTCADRYGFPRTRAKTVKRVQGFQTGDLVRLVQPGGRYAGTHTGRISVRERGAFDIQTTLAGRALKITAPAARFTLIQRGGGYAFAA